MLQNIVILVGMASLVATIFYYMKLPPVVGFLLAGILAGPGALSLVKDPLEMHSLTEIVAMLLMFTIGLEFSIKKLVRHRQSFLKLGLLQVLLSILIFVGIFVFGYGFEIRKAVFFSFVLTLSSTAIVFKLFIEKNEVESSHGQASTSILLFQDLALIPMMLLMPLLSGKGDAFQFTMMGGLIFVGKSLAILFFVYLSTEFIVPWLLLKVAKTKSQELFFFSILFICIGTAFLMGEMGFGLSLGAFIAGLVISDSAFGKQALSDFLPFRDILLGIFFVNIGMLLDIPFFLENYFSILKFGFAFIFVKAIVIFLLVWFWTNSTSLAIICGLVLAQAGEFSFLIFDEGVNSGLATKEEQQFFIACAILSIALTPFLYSLSPKISYNEQYAKAIPDQFSRLAKSIRKSLVSPSQNLKFEASDKKELSGHCIIVGFGPTGRNTARALKELKIPYSIIDINPKTVAEFSSTENIQYGDASKHEILEKASIGTAKLVLISIPGSTNISMIKDRVLQMRPDIHIIARTQYLQQIDEIGDNPNTEFVVGEFETSIEVLIRVLKSYSIDAKYIHDFVGSTRKLVHDLHSGLQNFSQEMQKWNHWEIFNNIHPLKLTIGDFETGKSLAELHLRKMTGASIIAIFREGIGTSHPHPEFVIEDDDILYLLGNKEQVAMVESFLRKES